MDVKVYFKINGVFQILMWIFIIPFLALFSYFAFFESNEIGFIIFVIVLDLLMILAFISSHIYGFRIKNNRLRIISQFRVRFCKYDDVKNLDIKFIQENKYYDCHATLEMNNGKFFVFEWSKLHNTKGPGTEFKITEEDVYKYKEILSVVDKINVEIL